jgi:hypothetical protein
LGQFIFPVTQLLLFLPVVINKSAPAAQTGQAQTHAQGADAKIGDAKALAAGGVCL